ncbi:DNA-entry nuclease [Halobacillus shinanisalinarum]|uniref:DNA-entry nuclease n=1 Tax=Halobacillus shinanisalinarum TaxID=2932258 RepID=A0ABY4GZN3_9BACI|nr:DNA-entry nuclease [Halobacillus shinanisalinarum]UOQ93396.1 DNA-entry nuclease [Halobacillus shinanisalinarum]
MSEVQYDDYGRMKYHPDFHPNHGKKMTNDEISYMCRFWETDGAKSIAAALGRTEKTLMSKVSMLRKQGRFDYYMERWNRMEAKEACI